MSFILKIQLEKMAAPTLPIDGFFSLCKVEGVRIIHDRHKILSIRTIHCADKKPPDGEVQLAIQKIKRPGGAACAAEISVHINPASLRAAPATSTPYDVGAKCSGCCKTKDDENLIKFWMSELSVLHD